MTKTGAAIVMFSYLLAGGAADGSSGADEQQSRETLFDPRKALARDQLRGLCDFPALFA